MKSINFFLILTFMILTSSLLIPVSKEQHRCMVAFSYGQSQTVKLELKFPPIPGRLEGQYFQIVATNTETKQYQHKSIAEGVLKYELNTMNRVIYEICIRIITSRNVGKLNVDYSANSNFQVAPDVIKVPQNLLKSEDLKGTYQNAAKIVALGDKFLSVQKARLTDQQKMFSETRDVGNSLVKLSIFELIIIFIVALFQLFSLRQLLTKNHYI